MLHLQYHPNSLLEKFGNQICAALVDKFRQTYFVGGMVRDIILNREITDIDIATEARPEQVARILESLNINCDLSNARFGIIIAQDKLHPFQKLEIATFRKDLISTNRYADVIFITDPKIDSMRRDFTINSLYISANTNEVTDYNDGVGDIANKIIRTIGDPKIRFTEDPLRIVRALRLAEQLNFIIEKNTLEGIKFCAQLIKKLTQKKLQSEINKINNITSQNKIKKLINSLLLDNAN